MRMRVGGVLSAPRPASVGAPQSSLPSPFLFNLTLADIDDYISRALPCDVRVGVYADDIAVFATVPVSSGRCVRTSVRTVLDSIDAFITSRGMWFSPVKTEAMLLHPSYGAQRYTPRFTLQTISIIWKKRVTNLGVQLDQRLTWSPVDSDQLRNARRVASTTRVLLLCDNECTTTLALRIYNGMDAVRILYGLPLAVLSVPTGRHWTQRIVLQFASFSACPDSLKLAQHSLGGRHAAVTPGRPSSAKLLRAHETLASRTAAGILALLTTHLPMGQCATAFNALVPRSPDVNDYSTPPCRHHTLKIQTRLPGVASKRMTPECALWQETAGTFNDFLAGRLLVFSDGSVLNDGCATAARVVPSLKLHNQCRLACEASSTIAELQAFDLAAHDLLTLESSVGVHSLGLTCCSPTPVAMRIAQKLEAAQDLGCDLVLQWIPAHVGISGNEGVDELAKDAHSPRTAVATLVITFDVACLRTRKGRVPPQNPKVYSRNAAEQGAPARMVALVACLRDALLSSDVPENDRLTLLEPIKLHASGWKLCLEQQLSYASLDDAAGDDCDYVQNLSPLPCRFSE
ncbi:uncharacterized protein LOC142775127 [Rhipicephalus microplus]|uniref:uncharacterized protein LOC142775127 n=1 Tax=Rhipicephalus microplus TaxID=6941 RepID=UPI003F6D2742